MSLMINQNITSLNAWRNLGKTDRAMSGTMEKLSSGLRINKAADDPSGLVISEQMRAQVVGLKAAIKNSEKGVSMIQTAEGALDKVHALLDKARGLALDSANSATSDSKMLAANQAEITNILQTITRISDNTTYGTKKLLNGDNWSAAATLDSANNNAGVTSVVESNLVAGTSGNLTVTVSNIVGTPTVYDNANTFAGTGITFDAQATAATNLASGDHALVVSGALDSMANVSDTSAAGVIDVQTNLATNSYTGGFTGTVVLTATTASADLGGAAATASFNFTENGTAKGTATWSQTAGTLTFNYTDGSQSSVITFGTKATDVDGALVIGDTFTFTVAASTAQASLDGGAAVTFNRASTFTDKDLVSGTDGGTVRFDFTEATFNANVGTYDFQVQKAGEGMARLGDGAMTVVGPGDTNVTLSSRDGTVTLDFGTIAAGTSTLSVEDNSLVFQIGANQGQTVGIAIRDLAANHLSVVANAETGSALASVTTADNLSEIDITTTQGAQDAITLIDAAIDEVSVIRGEMGAFQANTLEANLDSLRVSSENLQASESVIRDTDMAAEMATYTKYQIMMQAGTAMLAQANQIPNNLLSLLR